MTAKNAETVLEQLLRLLVLAVTLTAKGMYRLASRLYGELYAYAMRERRVK